MHPSITGGIAGLFVAVGCIFIFQLQAKNYSSTYLYRENAQEGESIWDEAASYIHGLLHPDSDHDEVDEFYHCVMTIHLGCYQRGRSILKQCPSTSSWQQLEKKLVS